MRKASREMPADASIARSLSRTTVVRITLTVTFDSRCYSGDPTDEFYLFVYCPALCTGRLATPIPRSAGIVTAVLPDEWLHADPDAATFPHSDNQGLHLYALLAVTLLHLGKAGELALHSTSATFLRGSKGRTSDTIYCSIPA